MRLSFDKVFDECVFSNGRQPHLPQAPFSGGKGRILTVLFSGLGWESDKVHKKTKRGGKKAGQFHGRPGKKSRVAPPEPLAEGMFRGGGCSGGAGAPEAGGKLTNRGAEWGGPRGQGRRPVRGKKRGSMEKINRKSLQFLRRCVAISQGIQYNNRKSFSG